MKVVIAENDLAEARNNKGNIIYEKLHLGQVVRFKDMFNIEIQEVGDPLVVSYVSDELLPNVRKIQVVPAESNIKVEVLQPSGEITKGFGEMNLKNLDPNTSVQFERYGYVNLRKIQKDSVFGYFTNT
jgi:hypothetical protein